MGVVFSLVHYFTVMGDHTYSRWNSLYSPSLGDRWSDLFRISYDIPKNKSVSSDRNLVYNIIF